MFNASRYVFLIFTFLFSLYSNHSLQGGSPLPQPIRTQIISMPAMLSNFSFKSFHHHWLLTENDWKFFWQKNSRTSGDAPELPINWRTESVLSIFWESKDDVVRIPSFVRAEVTETAGHRALKLFFQLNTPCYGIITDQSPAQFVIFDRNLSDVDSITVKTEETKTTGVTCSRSASPSN